MAGSRTTGSDRQEHPCREELLPRSRTSQSGRLHKTALPTAASGPGCGAATAFPRPRLCVSAICAAPESSPIIGLTNRQHERGA
jgi:hypothetical protein